jgi:gliding motility-associated-like protein
MKRLLFCCLLFFCLCSQKVLAEVFIVTSTLPSGPGSLREALEKAASNGRTGTDTIKFDISRAREMVIKIAPNNLLPALSENLVIDGVSQPGTNLGVSDAKLCVSLEGFYTGNALLYLFDARYVSNVSIYGLFIKGNVAHPATGQRPQQFYGILLQGSRNIRIGAPAKGNVISGWVAGVYDEYDSRFSKSSGVSIRSNIFGLDTDGTSITFGDRFGAGADNSISVNVKGNSGYTIGGSTPDDGNIFFSTNTDIAISGIGVNDGIATISNNKFGIDFRGGNIAGSTAYAINASNINSMPDGIAVLANPVITDNYIGGRSRSTAINGIDLHTHFLIENNTLGYEDATGGPDRDGFYGRGINIQGAFLATIKKNIIRYWKQGAIIHTASFGIRITENSTYCNKKRAIELRNWGPLNTPPLRPQPFAYINRIEPTRGLVSGTSLPDNIVELFYNEDCPTCEGKTHFATVNADSEGKWSYSGALASNNVIATATDIFFATSEYSVPKIDTTGKVIDPVTCTGGFGSICGIKILSGTRWHWENAAGVIVGYDTCLKLVPAGDYILKISIGNLCEESFLFRIPNVTPLINESVVSITSARCGLDNGSVCGIRVTNGVRWHWEDETGNILSTNLCFNNARPGRYRLRVEGQQNCIVYSRFFDVPNKVPNIDEANALIVHPSCGRNNGSITGIRLTDAEFSTRGWFNEAGTLVSSTTDLTNAAPGRYKLVVKDNSGACGDSTVYFTLNIVPPPLMNTAGTTVTDATCGNANGSITGITFSNITGTARYWWVNADGTIAGTNADLLNAAPGSYRLKVRDGSNCDTLFSPVYNITDKGSVQLDSSSITISPTGCNKITGAVKGMKINGATNLEWRNLTTGQLVGNTADIVNMPAGSYQLTATNSTYGCTVTSYVYVIPQAPPMPIAVLQDSTKQATCGGNNGSIKLTQLSSNIAWFTFKWLRDSVSVVGTGLSLTDLSPATYHCIATDTNGCEIAFYKKTIVALPLPVLNEANAAVFADTCEFKTGRITGIVATSDAAGLRYSWRTAAGQEVGTSPQLSNVSSGDYYLLITDARGCTAQSSIYSIPDVVATLPAPRYTPLINIARNSSATLTPLETRTGSFALYDRATGSLLAQNTSGSFVLNNVADDRDLFVRYTSGPCNSGEFSVRIKVFDETVLKIPNAFSPNNDGVNDLFRIQVTGYFRLNYLKIFNRFGQQVHECRDLALPWDGKRNGSDLPVGTYYWVIEGIDMHNKPVKRAGSITLIR